MKKRHTSGGSGQRRRKRKASRSVVRVSEADLTRLEDRSEWDRVDALTDEEIHAAISDDPDVAPALEQSFWRNVEILDPRHDKKTVTMRIDDDVLDFFRRGGAGYQSRMNAVLRAYVYARRERVS